jgi:hypothetical protein
MADGQAPGADEDVRMEAAARAGQSEMGWTKHGTPWMTRAVAILNRPAMWAEALDEPGAGDEFRPGSLSDN